MKNLKNLELFKLAINEGAMSEIDIMAKEAKNEKDFIKQFLKEYSDKVNDNPETRKWLKSMYSDATNESVDEDLDLNGANDKELENMSISIENFKLLSRNEQDVFLKNYAAILPNNIVGILKSYRVDESVNEGKMPDKYIGNDEIVYLKTKETSSVAHYSLYYKGHEIDPGGYAFGSEKELESFAKDYTLSNQLYKKLKYEDPKPLPESVTEAKTLKKGSTVKFKDGRSIYILGPKGDGYNYRDGREKGWHPKKWFDMMISTGKAVVESVNEGRLDHKVHAIEDSILSGIASWIGTTKGKLFNIIRYDRKAARDLADLSKHLKPILDNWDEYGKVEEKKDQTFGDYLKDLDARFEDGHKAAMGDNGGNKLDNRQTALHNLRLFGNYIKSLQKEYGKDKTKLTFMNESERPRFKKRDRIQYRLTHQGGVGKYANAISQSDNIETGVIAKRTRSLAGFKYMLTTGLELSDHEIIGLAESVVNERKIKVGDLVMQKYPDDWTRRKYDKVEWANGQVRSIKGDRIEINTWWGSILELPLDQVEFKPDWNKSGQFGKEWKIEQAPEMLKAVKKKKITYYDGEKIVKLPAGKLNMSHMIRVAGKELTPSSLGKLRGAEDVDLDIFIDWYLKKKNIPQTDFDNDKKEDIRKQLDSQYGIVIEESHVMTLESFIVEARAYKLKASEFGQDTMSAPYAVKGENGTWRVHSTYAIDQVSGNNNPEERDVVFFEVFPYSNNIVIKIGGIHNIGKTNASTYGTNFATTTEEWKEDPSGIAKQASDFLTDANHLKWLNKNAKSEGQKIKWALKDDYSPVIEDLVNRALGIKESIDESNVKVHKLDRKLKKKLDNEYNDDYELKKHQDKKDKFYELLLKHAPFMQWTQLKKEVAKLFGFDNLEPGSNDGEMLEYFYDMVRQELKIKESHVMTLESFTTERKRYTTTDFTKPGNDGDIYFSKREGNAIAIRRGDKLEMLSTFQGTASLAKVIGTDKRWENKGPASEKLLIDLSMENLGGLATRETQTEKGKLLYNFIESLDESVNEALPTQEIDPDKFPDMWKKDPNFFKKGYKDGETVDDAVNTKPVKIQASQLKPSQDAVYLGKALGMAIGGVEGGNLEAIISLDNRILDGHHRWAATIFNNPKARVGGVQADLRIGDLIPVLRQAGDALGNKRGLPPKGGDVNIFKATLEDVRNCVYNGENMNPEFYNKDKAIAWFEEKGENAIQASLNLLQRVGPPAGAPPRADMPKVEPNQVKTVAKKLSGGAIDVRKPYVESLENFKYKK